MRQRVSGFLGHARGRSSAEHVGQLPQRGEQVHDTQTGDGAANEVIRDDRADGRDRFHEVVAIPERRPRNEDQQESRFEQEGDEQQASEQTKLSFGLHFREAIDPACDIAIAAGLGFELDEDGQRAGALTCLVERLC